jgi:hypothetical protein
LKHFFKDDIVTSKFPPPLTEGDGGEGKIIGGHTATDHPHPNPPPSRGEGNFRLVARASKRIESYQKDPLS